MSRYRYAGGAAILTVAQWPVILGNTPLAQAQIAAPSPLPGSSGVKGVAGVQEAVAERVRLISDSD